MSFFKLIPRSMMLFPSWEAEVPASKNLMKYQSLRLLLTSRQLGYMAWDMRRKIFSLKIMPKKARNSRMMLLFWVSNGCGSHLALSGIDEEKRRGQGQVSVPLLRLYFCLFLRDKDLSPVPTSLLGRDRQPLLSSPGKTAHCPSAQDNHSSRRHQGDTHQHPPYLSHQLQPAGYGEGRYIPRRPALSHEHHMPPPSTTALT